MATKEEIDQLGHSLAYESAASAIECHSLTYRVEGEEPWCDVGRELHLIEDDVRYLEMRGLLERHPDHPEWVRVHDESEATA